MNRQVGVRLIGLLALIAGCSNGVGGDSGGGAAQGSGGDDAQGSGGDDAQGSGGDDAQGSGGDDAQGSGGGDGGAGGSVPGQVDEGLFACGLTPTCGSFSLHLYPAGALGCGAELVLAGGVGVIVTGQFTGGNPNLHSELIVLKGDGTAIKQTRGYSCDGVCDPLPPWTMSGMMQCAVSPPEGLAEACEADDESEACRLWPDEYIVDCQPIEDVSCEAIAEVLDAP